MIDIFINLFTQFNDEIKNNIQFYASLYFLLSLIYFTLSLPGNLFIICGSSFLFGFQIGFFVNIISAVLGSLFFSLLFKSIIRKILKKYFSKNINKLDKIIMKSSYEYLIILRLIIGLPLILQNAFISSLNISKVKLIITSFVGFTPYFIVFSFLGSKLSNFLELKSVNISNLFTVEFLLLFLTIILFLLIRIIYKFRTS